MTSILTGSTGSPPRPRSESDPQAQLKAHRRELATLGAEADALRSDLDTVLAELDDLRAERDRLRTDVETGRTAHALLLADRDAVVADRALVAADRDAVVADRALVAADRDAVVADRRLVAAARDAAVAAHDAVVADRAAVLRDLAADRTARADERATLEAALAAVTHDRAAVAAARDAAAAERDAVVADRERVREAAERAATDQRQLRDRLTAELHRATRAAAAHQRARAEAATADYDRELREQAAARFQADLRAEIGRQHDLALAVDAVRRGDRARADHLASELRATRRTVSWWVTRPLRVVRRRSSRVGFVVQRFRRFGRPEPSLPSDPIARVPALRPVPAPEVLDLDYYRRRHPDLTHLTDAELIEHFAVHGRSEGRPASSWLRRSLVLSPAEDDDRERVLVVLDGATDTDVSSLIAGLAERYHVVTVLQHDSHRVGPVAAVSGTTVVLDDTRSPVADEAGLLVHELGGWGRPHYAVVVSADCSWLAAALEAAAVPVVAVAAETVDATERSRRQALSATVSAVVHENLSTARCVELVDEHGRRAAQVRLLQEQELRTILQPGGFDAIHYSGGQDDRPRELLAREYQQRVRIAAPLQRPGSGILVHRPRPGFHPLAYAESAPDFVDDGRDPLAHYLAAGRPPGRWASRIITPEPWNPSRRRRGGSGPVLVHGHFHYPEMSPAFLDRLAGNRSWFRLVLTTTTVQAADRLTEIAHAHPAGAGARVVLVPNRGRNLSALFSGPVAELMGQHEVVLHVHGKSSPHLHPEFGRRWRDHLWAHLVGDGEPFADQLVAEFAASPRLGLVAAEDRYLHDWDTNAGSAADLMTRLGRTLDLPAHFDFPQGAMFWARTSALTPFLRAGFDDTDYPPEPLTPDGTMLHALERLIPLIVQDEGFEYAKTHLASVQR